MFTFLKVITAPDTQLLAERVNKALAEGWKFHGTVFATTDPDSMNVMSPWFHQAMTLQKAQKAKKS